MKLRYRNWLFAALALSTLVKLYFAIFTHGTTDVDAFKDHLDKVRQFGVQAYHYRGVFDNPFNSPPPMIHVIKAIGWLSDSTGASFGFWLRLFPILAGVGIFFLAWRILKDRSDLFPLLLALALNPISIMVDGHHGNTDSIIFFFILLSVYFVQERRLYALAGLVFGLAWCVKLVPLMFVPIFLLYLPDWKARFKFGAVAASTFILASMPYLLQDPIAIKNSVFGYNAIYGIWGIPQLLAMFWPVHPVYAHEPFDPIGIHGVFATALRYIAIAAVCAVSVWMNTRRPRPSLYIQCGVAICVLLFLAPGFGMQYLVWLVPFVLVLGLRTTLIYYGAAGLYLALKYGGIADTQVNAFLLIGALTSLAAWFTLRILLGHYYRLIKDEGAQTTRDFNNSGAGLFRAQLGC